MPCITNCMKPIGTTKHEKHSKHQPLSRVELLKRGICCHHGCRNCPWKPPVNMNEKYSKEFNQWAAGYFSWTDPIDHNDVESHWMAWNASRNRAEDIVKSTETKEQILEKLDKL